MVELYKFVFTSKSTLRDTDHITTLDFRKKRNCYGYNIGLRD